MTNDNNKTHRTERAIKLEIAKKLYIVRLYCVLRSHTEALTHVHNGWSHVCTNFLKWYQLMLNQFFLFLFINNVWTLFINILNSPFLHESWMVLAWHVHLFVYWSVKFWRVFRKGPFSFPYFINKNNRNHRKMMIIIRLLIT